MNITAVINMKNPNALIAMAQVAQNASNPYDTFCEYIKYCVFTCAKENIKFNDIKESIGDKFGLHMPNNILFNCLTIIAKEGLISFDNHTINRIGSYDTSSFERELISYKKTETAIIKALVDFVSTYKRVWTEEYARDVLIKTLDGNGLAYDIFMYEKKISEDSTKTLEMSELVEFLPDDEEQEKTNGSEQPLITDEHFVSKFIDNILASNNVYKEYLRKICEGMMICVGTYQLPSMGSTSTKPQIKGTEFFFDTKLLLRFLGCASEAAVTAARELVTLIQNAGGKIYYYPQTSEEIDRAFEKAIRSLTNHTPPRDEEMRLYAASIENTIAVIRSKKATYKTELNNAGIYLKPHAYFSDKDNVRYGFDKNDLQQFMQKYLSWEDKTIENDALAIWETHMYRKGNYNDYCGTNDQLPVFVTTNSKLIGVALKFREERSKTKELAGWRQNRLPVITDIRLTCRLWSPSSDSERLSLLYLTANVVAAKRPTERYLNEIRELAIKFREQTPEYSGICLPAYFDDEVTDIIIEKTLGESDNLDITTFANTIFEMSELKAKEQEEKTNQALNQLDFISKEFDAQTESIISGAVESNKNKLGLVGIFLWIILHRTQIITILFAAIISFISYLTSDWHLLFITLIPSGLSCIEQFLASNFIAKKLLKRFHIKIEKAYNNQIIRNLRSSELPYQDIIMERAKHQTKIWLDYINMIK
ncbi:MAG: hypothetical protein IKJ93_00015 [Clostridia bacterium]|nr:hypothetical protein [Clostridia bacterium]